MHEKKLDGNFVIFFVAWNDILNYTVYIINHVISNLGHELLIAENGRLGFDDQ